MNTTTNRTTPAADCRRGVLENGVFDIMGIRVYIRNTADTNNENEICLGKLYAYADGNENFESVDYMIKHHCFCAEYMEYFYEYHDNYENLADHVEFLSCETYLNYGDFAYFRDAEIFEFLLRFANDCNEFWKPTYPKYDYNTRNIWDMIVTENEIYHNSTWEIRQGA